MPVYVSLKIGVDPATVSVGDDGVVRYVVVMRNAAGSVTAAYEGVRCTTDEVKTYARSNGMGGWTTVADPQWKSLTDNMPSRHAHAITRQGACSGHIDRFEAKESACPVTYTATVCTQGWALALNLLSGEHQVVPV
jgi:hypothetical protein